MTRVVWAVIRREYLQRVRTRWFVVGTLALPLFMAGLIFIPAWFAERQVESSRSLMVLDHTGVMADELATRLQEADFTVLRLPPSAQRVDQLEALVRDGVIAGFLVLDDASLERGRAVYHGEEGLSTIRELAVRQAVVQTALSLRLDADRNQVRTLLGGGSLEYALTAAGSAEVDQTTFAAAYVGAFMLYMTILLYAVAVMRSVLEEKTNRVVEVIVSSMRPFHLMLGKILGVGAVGLTQLAIWAVCGMLLAGLGLPYLLAANPDAAPLREILRPGSLASYLGYFGIFFLGGYFMYSGLYAAVGAMCSSDEEAQQAQMPVVLVLVVPVAFVTPVIQDPSSALATGLSLFPLFTPVLMYARIAAGGVPLWQLGLAVAGMALSVLAIAWLAGRIYKVGILMTGKRPTLPELWRWVREA